MTTTAQKPAGPRSRSLLKVNQSTYARVFALMLQYPCSTHELAQHTGLHIVTIQSLMRTMKKHKVVHIVSWEKDRLGRDCTPVYAFGKGADKPRACKSRAEVSAQHRARQKQKALLQMMAGQPANDDCRKQQPAL